MEMGRETLAKFRIVYERFGVVEGIVELGDMREVFTLKRRYTVGMTNE